MGAFDGNGNFVRSYSWVQDKTNGIPITSSRMDTEDNGFAGGLTLAVTRDGQGKMATHFQPSADNTYDLGQNALRWRNLFLAGNATIVGNVAVTGTLSGISVPQFLQKTTAQTVTNSATPVIDTAIQSSTFGPPATFQFEALLLAGNSSPGGLQVGLNLNNPNPTHSSWIAHGRANGAAYVLAQQQVSLGGSPSGVVLSSAQAVGDWHRIEGYFATGSGTAGILALYWAQAVANATGTTLAAGSYMKLTQINQSFF